MSDLMTVSPAWENAGSNHVRECINYLWNENFFIFGCCCCLLLLFFHVHPNVNIATILKKNKNNYLRIAQGLVFEIV